MPYRNRVFVNVLLSVGLFILFVYIAIEEEITDIVRFFLRDRFTATLAVLIVFVNAWMSWSEYHKGLDYLEGLWSVEVRAEKWRGEEDRPTMGKGNMYLVRAKSRNSFNGYIQLEYVDRLGKRMFVATYHAQFDLKMNHVLSSTGNVEGSTTMICRMPVEKDGHDSFVKEHIQKLIFNKKSNSLEGETRIEAQKVLSEFKAIKLSP